MNKLLVILLFVCVFTGCTTMQSIGRIKNHNGNMEAKVGSNSETLDWQSVPDYSDSVSLPKVPDCNETNYYISSGFWNRSLVPLDTEYADIQIKPYKSMLSKLLSGLKSCDVLIIAKHACVGNCVPDSPVSIEFINQNGNVLYSFSPPKRENIPLRNWPELALAGIIDLPFVLLALPFTPLLLLED